MIKKASLYTLLLLIAFFIHVVSYADIGITGSSCENKINPLGVDLVNLHFSWQLSSKENGNWQKAYQIVCASSPENMESGKYDVWNSGRVPSSRSLLLAYHGKKLNPGTVYYWQVRVWDRHDAVSAWSGQNHFTTGLFSRSDWDGAQWIAYEIMPDSMRVVPGVHYPYADKMGDKGMRRPVVPLFRKAFRIDQKISQATIFVCGLGQYELSINGARVSSDFLTPGWTDYDKRCLYNSYDVTHLLNQDNNVLGVVVGNGFYNINRERYFKLTDAFGYPKLICCLKIIFEDGHTESIITDNSWKTAPSPITFTSIYGGEDYDARLEQPGWNKAGFDDAQWKKVLLTGSPLNKLCPEMDFPVSICDSFDVKKITQLKPGTLMYDFGQNASGIISLKIKGERGQTVKLIPSELITDSGFSDQKAVSEGMSGSYYLTYTLKSDQEEIWRPRFTYYGFRYVQVEGASAGDSADGSLPHIVELKSLHNRSAAPSNGSFECSNDLFNKIFTLINWAIKSNMQSIITDCPHREKLGWLEQDYLMGTSINYNFNIYHLYKKIIRDIMDAQTDDGLVPDIAPEYVKFEGGFRDSPEWGSASVILPWLVYHWYGDAEIIQEAYPMMQRYVAYLKKKSVHSILNYGLGDWYDYGPGAPGDAQLTPKALTATAIYYYDVSLLGKMAAMLQKPKDAEHYKNLAEQIKTAFNIRFFNSKTKVYATGSQTSMAMPWCVGLVQEKDRNVVLQNLIDSIQHTGNALTAGDIGFHFLVEALDEGGASQMIYEMNNRNDVPGYGLQLKKGATALTESWNALEESSNNHLMLGHIMEWFYSGLAGISQQAGSVAFKQLIIRPEPVGDIVSAKGSFNTPYGMVISDWKKTDEGFLLHLIIPVNTSASVYLPATVTSTIYQNKERLGKNRIAYSGKTAMVQVQSGEYYFEVK
ncbi:MAG: family 78 glycoside hydrolase catalytic domain [Bacteroidota bacterium]|nr:family 78 glycoside hydrolase catalytic domain [Bacteroidota bacterium]